MRKSFAFALLLVLFTSLAANADTICTPQIGGGHGVTGVGMVMVEVSFDGTNLAVGAPVGDTPVLRPLPAGCVFTSGTSYYSALTGKAYNYQYGWDADASLSTQTLPGASAVWVKLLDETAGLQTYYRNDYSEILQSAGSIWQWGLGMQHNTYAVLNPTQSVYAADYNVYIGNAATGAPLPGYGSANVTFTWNATPTTAPEPSTFVMGSLALAVVGLGRVWRRRRKA